MERELFDWDGWDGEPECMTFYDVTLKQQIGQFPPGTKFAGAIILVTQKDYGVLQFYNLGEEMTDGQNKWHETNVMAEFKLHYHIGEQLS